jgi:HD domain/GAF domain
MTRIRIKTFAISAIALLAAPTAAFGASGDDGYSPPGGQPQLAFTGRDLYLWGGLGLLLVGVGLGLRRLTAPSGSTEQEPTTTPDADAEYGATETAGPDPLHVPASVGGREPTQAATLTPAAVAAGDVEPTVAAAVPTDAPAREPRRERSSRREPAAAAAPVAVVRPRDRSRLALEHGVAQALVQAGDEQGLLETAAAHIAGALDADGAAVLRREDDARGPHVLAQAGELAHGVDRSDGAAATALGEGRVARGSGMDTGYELAAPIHVGGRVWGVVATDAPQTFTEGDAGLAGALAAQVGEALTALWAVRDADGDVFAARKLAGATDEPGDARLAEYREIARQAMSIGSKLGVPDTRLKTLYIAGLFHDLGLAGVPHDLTTGGRRLSDEERRLLDQHPLTGARMMRQSPRLRDAAEIVRHLGEHYDGTGIPEGLSGTSIPLESRILSAVVAHSSLDPETAPLVLRAARGTQFDPDVVDVVLETSPALAPALA